MSVYMSDISHEVLMGFLATYQAMMLPFIPFLKCFINLTFLLHRAVRIKWDILLDIWQCCTDFWCVWGGVCVCVCVCLHIKECVFAGVCCLFADVGG